MDIAHQVRLIRQKVVHACEQAGRNVADVRLMAVTKQQNAEVLPILLKQGVNDFGENRPDHADEMRSSQTPDQAQQSSWHFIGRLQSRQLKRIVPWAHTIHSVAQPDHLRRIDDLAQQCEKSSRGVYPSKRGSGAAKRWRQPSEVAALLALARSLDHINCVGLMCMAPDRRLVDDERVMHVFRRLAQLGEQYDCERLSMGMSQDFELAIAAGATDIRIGSSLFC